MTTYAIGSDHINGKEHAYINQAIQKIQDSGNEGQSIGVNPNVVQRYGLKSEAEGKIGVMIVGGRGLGTPMDFHTGVTQGYYHYTHVYVIGSSEFTGNKLIGSSSMDTPVTSCERQMNTRQCSKYKGLTPKQFNEKYTGCTVIYCDNFCDGLNSITNTDGTTSDDSNSQDTGTSYKDMIQDIIKVWDGEIEAWIENNIFNLRRIPKAEQDEPVSEIKVRVNNRDTIVSRNIVTDHNILRTPEIWASESVNITSDGLDMADYNPNTINVLLVTYTDTGGVEHTISFVDEILASRFGEKSLTMEAVKYAHFTPDETENNNSTSSDNDSSTTDSDSGDDESDSSSDSSSDTNSSEEVVEIPIETYEEALHFGLGQWYKLQRDNGHTIECKVLGSNLWRVGRWCKVYLPVFSEYCDMYVNRASHTLDDDGEWLVSLELLPAPACIKADDTTTVQEQNSNSEDEDGDNTDA